MGEIADMLFDDYWNRVLDGDEDGPPVQIIIAEKKLNTMGDMAHDAYMESLFDELDQSELDKREPFSFEEAKDLFEEDNPTFPHIWVTLDGRELYIAEMETNHIYNTIVFLRRRKKEGLHPYYADRWIEVMEQELIKRTKYK